MAVPKQDLEEGPSLAGEEVDIGRVWDSDSGIAATWTQISSGYPRLAVRCTRTPYYCPSRLARAGRRSGSDGPAEFKLIVPRRYE